MCFWAIASKKGLLLKIFLKRSLLRILFLAKSFPMYQRTVPLITWAVWFISKGYLLHIAPNVNKISWYHTCISMHMNFFTVPMPENMNCYIYFCYQCRHICSFLVTFTKYLFLNSAVDLKVNFFLLFKRLFKFYISTTVPPPSPPPSPPNMPLNPPQLLLIKCKASHGTPTKFGISRWGRTKTLPLYLG